jgi:hypothetical protein
MADMNTSPKYTGTLRADVATISTANTNRDGTGTVATICTAGAQGTRIDRVHIQAQGTTTAGVVRIFLHNGSAYFLWEEVLVSAITPGTGTEAFSTDVVRSDGLPYMVLPSGYSLRASTHNAESFTCAVLGGDY